MADSIEEKWPKSIVGCIIFMFIIILLLATVVPNDMIDRAMSYEHEMGHKLLTEHEMKQIISATDGIYISTIIDSGVKAKVADVFMPRAPSSVDAFEEKVSWWFGFLAQRGEALQKIVYQVIYRVVLAAYWLPFFAAVAIPAIFAGLMRWSAKRYAFEYSSPFVNNNSMRMLIWGAIIMVLGAIFPAPLPPLIICTMLIAIMPTVFSLLISNLPKRI